MDMSVARVLANAVITLQYALFCVISEMPGHQMFVTCIMLV